MNKNKLIFEEKQNLGLNKQALALRIFLSLFCFVAYYYTDIPEANGDLLFFLGVAILLISLLLLFVTHIKLQVDEKQIIIQGILGSGKVVIPLENITAAKKVQYSRFVINNPVYNLHRKGVVKFYSGGNEAVRIECNNDTTYLIGTQKADEFIKALGYN